MDIPRERRRRPLRGALLALAVVASAAAAVTAGARFKERLTSVRRGAIWTGRVERSPFVVRVKGPGVLLPEAVRWLTAESSGRVEEVLRKPGSVVEETTAVVRLENLDVRLQALQAERDEATGRSDLLALSRRVGEDEITGQSDALQLHSSLSEAERRADVYTRADGSFVSALDTKRAGEQASELERRTVLAEQKINLIRTAGKNQLAALQTQLARREEVSRVHRELVDHLVIRAGTGGVLQDVLVELGQWVVPGTPVAKVIVSDHLKAELRIPEEQAGGISVGQGASIDTRAGSIVGHVRRVASSANQGTVKVEIALDGEMPRGVRPDQNVDGCIEIERTDDALHMPRPVSSQADAVVSVFRIDPATGVARRMEARTGRVSVDTVEIRGGLEPGDEVILSDMSKYANADAVQVE
jgi:HlyD family secretion protein